MCNLAPIANEAQRFLDIEHHWLEKIVEIF
jgi:hypothetical protein